ncbi:MAG: putative anion transporting ATPase [Acidimicrobiales bacterium]|nr:putative anion transporting ATPase [Acidimicrobiales bacterium]
MSAVGETAQLASILQTASLLVTCGPGGVGKTTGAAALGIAAARRGRRVVVVTVDPARRLADALGIDVDAKMFEPHEVTGVGAAGGSLEALMLDAETTFDRMIIERAGDEAKAAKILANPVYRSIAGSLAGAQDYMAIERLHQLHSSGLYDLVIIDTPPSRDAIDLLEAPERLMRFLGHPIYRALTMPSRSFAKVANAGTSAFLWIVRRLAGPRLVEDTVEFFRSLSGMEQGLRQRAGEVADLLRADSTSFVLVSSPRSEAIDESTHLANAIIDGGFGLDAVVINLVHPLPPALDDSLDLDALGEGPLAEHVAYHRELLALATSERHEMAALTDVVSGVHVTEVPLLEIDVHDIDGLTRLAALLVGE